MTYRAGDQAPWDLDALIQNRGIMASLRTIPNRVALFMHSFGAEQMTTGDGTNPTTTGRFIGEYPREINFGNNGWFSQLQRRIGHRFSLDPAMNKSIGGQTSAQILARLDSDIIANRDKIDIVFIDVRANDGPAGILKETSWANEKTIIDRCLALGLVVVATSTLPRTGWTGASGTQKTLWSNGDMWCNDMRRRYVRQLQSVAPLYLVDAWADFSDPANVAASHAGVYTVNSAGLRDGLHPSGFGGSLYARRAEIDLAPLIARLPANSLRSLGVLNGYSVDNPNGNAFANSGFLTTNGGEVTAITAAGGAPASWRLAQTGTTVAGEVNYSTLPAGPPSLGATLGNIAQFVANLPTGKAAITKLMLRQTATLAPGVFTPGRKVVLSGRVRATGLQGFAGAEAEHYYSPDNGITFWRRRDGIAQYEFSAEQIDQDLWLRTPELIIPDVPVTQVSCSVGFNIYFDARTAPASGTVQLSDLQFKAID